MKHLDSYLPLCTEYYDLDKPTAPEKDLNFYLSFIREAQGKILEPMCGSGRFLIPMVERGFDIDGFDASEAMLASLRGKCREKSLSPNIWKGFLQDLDEPAKYSLIFIPSGSFGLILDLDEAAYCLKKIYESLELGGTFVFEGETLYCEPNKSTLDLQNRWTGSCKTRPDGKTIILSTLALPQENGISHTLCRYELVDSNEVVKTEIESFKVRLYEIGQLLGLLQKAGFKDIRTHKAFERMRSPDEKDDVIVIECKK